MNADPDDSAPETRGKMLPFQRSPVAARKNEPGLRKHWLSATIAAVLVLAGVGGLLWSLRPKSAVQYITARVSRGSIARTVTATGTVNPVLSIIVGSYVSGRIESIYCDYNTHVRAGQVCAKIDPRPFQATLDQYTGQLLRDQAILNKDRVNLTRYQKLAAQSAIARQQAEDQAYVVKQDEGTVKLDQALVESAKLNLGYTNIISPVEGTVVSRNVTSGQTVAASFQTPTLFLIATDLKEMEVDTSTSEGDMGGIKVGDTANFTVDAYPQRVFHGAVTQIRQSPQEVQNVVTYDVVVGVDNNDLALMPGMTASTQIVVEQRNNVLRVPDEALRFTPGGLSAVGAEQTPPSGKARVWVLRDGKLVAVPVVTGLDDGTFTEIVQGDLHVGEQIITGEAGLQAGARRTAPIPRL
jgi:HlyD family secretion protein